MWAIIVIIIVLIFLYSRHPQENCVEAPDLLACRKIVGGITIAIGHYNVHDGRCYLKVNNQNVIDNGNDIEILYRGLWHPIPAYSGVRRWYSNMRVGGFKL